MDRLSIAVFSIVLFGSGAFQQSALAQTTSGSVVGTVYDKSGKGVAAALVIAENEINETKQTTKSSASGTYSIPNLPQGKYKLTARKQGFVEDTIAHFVVQFQSKEPRSITQAHAAYRHSRQEQSSIEDSNPLRNAEIFVTNQSDGVSRAASTNEYGNYSVRSLHRQLHSHGFVSRRRTSLRESVLVALDRRVISAPAITILVEAVSTGPSRLTRHKLPRPFWRKVNSESSFTSSMPLARPTSAQPSDSSHCRSEARTTCARLTIWLCWLLA